MERDEKIDGLTEHLLVAHEDQRQAREDVGRLLVDLERLVKEVRESKETSYKINLNMEDFFAEARLLINDRVGEMSVERLAEIIPRHKIDQVRALQFSREKGLPEPLPPPPMREATDRLPLIEGEERAPWWGRLLGEVIKAGIFKIFLLIILVVVAIAGIVVGTRLLNALDHSHVLPAVESHEK